MLAEQDLGAVLAEGGRVRLTVSPNSSRNLPCGTGITSAARIRHNLLVGSKADVFDAMAHLVVRRGDAGFLVRAEHGLDRQVADGMSGHLPASLGRVQNLPSQCIGIVYQEASLTRLVGVVAAERGGAQRNRCRR